MLTQAATLLAGVRSALVLTGAGLSAESGIPVFRGPAGLWKRFRPEELATPVAFVRMPREVWAWYRWRLEQVLASRPNEGHRALARLAGKRSLKVLNQNVDGLLEEAFREEGADEGAIESIHGSIRHAHCANCGVGCPMEEVAADDLPLCSSCGGYMRPSVIWFGETLAQTSLSALESEPRRRELLISIGTSAQVWPAASVLPAMNALGKPVIELNSDPDSFSQYKSIRLEGSAASLMPQLVREAVHV